ncbi:MAG TPA: NUDIX hydrolase [Candidatus Saccharimonadales bacterium]|nr:NUDIX hydrolase [Candidatus Saccharimonadales bacterium]
MSHDEELDIVSLEDEPTGKVVKYSVAHKNGVPHRIAAVLIFRPNGKLLVQRHKDFNRKLDHSVGGHVRAGEDYETAAKREMEEELGLKIPLAKVAQGIASVEHYSNPSREMVHLFGVFTARVPADWQFAATEEVDQIAEMTIPDIVEGMNKEPDRYLQGFMVSLGAYLKSINSDETINAQGENRAEP